MLDKDLIVKKLALIGEYLEELEPLTAQGEGALLADKLKYHTAERLFQLVVDTMIDINTHIIRGLNLAAPDDPQSTFITLGDGGVLPQDFAKKVAPIVGLRNAVVHRYETVSVKRFVHELVRDFNDFKTYATAITERFIA
jgi:uncharacterized protein YutE (UPF0331/DUF86 family)